MDIMAILDQKNNIFDHILYEFEMYIFTYRAIQNEMKKPIQEPFMKNILIESHAIHIRNLIEFMNREENCITTETIFATAPDFSFDDSRLKAKQTINKAIEHLTEERYKWNAVGEKNLTINFARVVISLHDHFLFERINSCVELLISGKDVKDEFKADLNDSRIQKRLLALKKTLHHTVSLG